MSPLTIAQIETVPFRLPMIGELRWGQAGRLQEVYHVLVRVRLSDGSMGVAEAPPRPTIYGETVSSIVSVVRDELAPRLIGLDLQTAAAVWQESLSPIGADRLHQPWPVWIKRLYEVKNNQTAKGAVDMALHHALAQSQGISLAQHLGASQEQVRVSYILGMGERETMLAEAQQVVSQGVRVLKVKVGQEWEKDCAAIHALHQSLGSDVHLYADANEGFTPPQAAQRLVALAEMGLLYCEEPLPVHLIRERAALRAAGHLPLIGDDSCFSLADQQRELALDTFDILNIKTARTGFSESISMLALARSRGKGVMVGSQASAGLGTLGAAHFSALQGVDHPCELSFFLKLTGDILNRPIPIRDGYIHLADLAGIEVDPAALAAASPS